MLWVGWRQQRTETVIAAALLALLAVVLVPTGLQLASAYHSDGLSGCVGVTPSHACQDAMDAFFGRFGHLGDMLAWMTLVPGVFGVLLAARSEERRVGKECRSR